VQQALLDMMVPPEQLEQLDILVQQVLLVLLAYKEQRVPLEQLVSLEIQDQLVQQEQPD
jgi:hypothetical protein